MNGDMFDLALEQCCTCTDPFGIPGYEPGCRAHAANRAIQNQLTAKVADASLLGLLSGLLQYHFRNDPPGPTPSPSGLCWTCGGTGEVYIGPGPDGHVWGGECGCETPYCAGCGQTWPCDPVMSFGEWAGLDREDLETAHEPAAAS